MAQGKSSKGLQQATRKPAWNAQELYASLRRYDRSPFLDVLQAWLLSAPTPEDIAALASKKPDLWVKAVTDLARIGGYTEKQEMVHTVNVNQMSDSQLADRARALAKELGIPLPPALTVLDDESKFAREFNGETVED